MAELDTISRTPEAAWYAIRDEQDHAVERYVVSTPQGREIVNRPEVVGSAYTRALGAAVKSALETAPFADAVRGVREEAICVLHVLRGGLSFGIREGVASAYGIERHGSAFLSSQRRQERDGTWRVYEDLYRKMDVPDEAVVLVGDVVATGVTLAHTLRVLAEDLADRSRRLRRIVLFTIGCENAEALMAHYLPRLASPLGGTKATVVYLEGRFALAPQGTTVPLALAGTDLVRRGALLTPELVKAQHEDATAALERCVIYDAGSRAFDASTYLHELLGYWQELHELARDGFRLDEALMVRAGTGASGREGSADALEALCAARIETLASLGPRPTDLPATG